MATLEEALAVAQSNSRICPKPRGWKRLYEMLPDREQGKATRELGLPLILAAWYDSTPFSKMWRLREHLEWAEEHGALDDVLKYISTLPESEWYHFGE